MTVKLGIIREGKMPPDKRVPLSPQQCLRVMEEYPNVKIFVEKSKIRAFKDEEYESMGIPVVDNLENCDILMGVKEVNIEDLIPNKQYLFFSHTFKKQPYNRKLLQAIVDKKIVLTDYEALRNEVGTRIIGFGRYAGIVGTYNGFLTYGEKHKLYQLKPANKCEDRNEMEVELKKVKLPKGFKMVLTGFGRVGHGAREIVDLLPIKEVSPEELLTQSFDEPIYAHLDVNDYVERSDGKPFDKDAFYQHPEGHSSSFPAYLNVIDLYIACHYWKEGSPVIFNRNDLKQKNIQLSVVADISCDIDGPVASTIRPSTIADPIYGYNVQTESEVDFRDENAIAVMAVDNLPCELPKDASIDFGDELIKNVFPLMFGEDPHGIIDKATETTENGTLNVHYAYLSDYLKGLE